MTLAERIKGRKIGVLGMARSGIAVARLIKRFGGTVFVSDSAEESALQDSIRELVELGIDFETGKHSEKLLVSDYLVLSPGVSPGIDIVGQAREKGIPLFSELEIGSWFVRGDIIAVTGSNGKTTTVTMIERILKEGGYESVLCGNIGTPLSAVAPDLSRNTVVALEVSSYQLEYIEQFAPRVAVVTNITADHLDRHQTIERYRATKLRMTENQTEHDVIALNAESDALDCRRVTSDARRVYFGRESALERLGIDKDSRAAWEQNGIVFVLYNNQAVKLFSVDKLQTPGWHNVENAMAAAAACSQFGVHPEHISSALQSFQGVEHRIEFVGEIAEVRFVNDSKATNIDALEKALEAINTPVRLIIGGRGKGEDFSRIGKYAKSPVMSIAAIGETQEDIFSALGKTIPVSFGESLEKAVETLMDEALPGETILLSPACASFDMFANFEERGKAFKNVFETLKARQEANVLKG